MKLAASGLLQAMNDRPQTASPDFERGNCDRQPEAPRPCATRVQVEHAVDRVYRWFMRVSGDDYVDLFSHGIDV
jgi:hypothetical protein